MSYLVNPLYFITISILTYALQRVNINFFFKCKKNINSIKNVLNALDLIVLLDSRALGLAPK
jgi:hypothetical protein